MNNIINKIEENGNHFIDTIIKPMIKGSKNILINDNKIVLDLKAQINQTDKEVPNIRDCEITNIPSLKA